MDMPNSAWRRLHRLWAAVLLGALVLGAPPDALAVDQPIAGRTLRLQRSADGARMLFASRDPAFPFPPIGGADDPATGTPGGVLIELLARSAPAQYVVAHGGLGNPGWRVVRSGAGAYVYRGHSELRSVVLSRGRLFQARAADARVPLDATLGAVAVRVTTGSLRSCAVFDGASVRRDRPGLFAAQNAPAPAIPDCSDASLAAALGDPCALSSWPACGGACDGDGVCAPEPTGGGCRCVSPTQPCGETAPLCSGQCPAGEQCWQIDSFIPGAVNACLCAPAGAPPCGATGTTCGGGACPAGLECEVIPGGGIYESACGCQDPDAVCGEPGYGTCGPDMQCLLTPGLGFQCYPILCSGTYPACGGSCSGGRECVPLAISSSELCVCAMPSSSCDGPACGGLHCANGDVCTVDTSGGSTTCSCQAP